MRDKLGRWVKGGVSPRKGVKVSEEARRKMSLAKIGHTPWNKGTKGIMPPPWHKGTKGICKSNKTSFSKGFIPWNKGTRGVMKAWNKGKTHIYILGDKNPSWKGGITEKNRLERNLFSKTFRKKVFERDNYTCQTCFKRAVSLHVDHIKSWADYPDLRFEIENCRTLCIDCHYKITFKKPKPKGIKNWGRNMKNIKLKERMVL